MPLLYGAGRRLGLCRLVLAATPRPEGAFGVRQLAAAFKGGPMCLFFKGSPESGSKLPHSESPTHMF
jgi:hypothetical protein